MENKHKSAADIDTKKMHREMGTEHHASAKDVEKKREQVSKEHSKKMEMPGHY